jgi:hypothetical protein
MRNRSGVKGRETRSGTTCDRVEGVRSFLYTTRTVPARGTPQPPTIFLWRAAYQTVTVL